MTRVLRLVDRAHAALADAAHDLVAVGQHGADERVEASTPPPGLGVARRRRRADGGRDDGADDGGGVGTPGTVAAMTRPACVRGAGRHQRRAVSRADVRPGRKGIMAGRTARHGQLGESNIDGDGRRRSGASSSTSTVPWSTRCRRISLPGPRSRAATASTFPEARFYSLGGVPTAKIAAMLIAEAGLTLDPVAIALEKEQMYYDSLAAGGGVRPIAAVLDLARRHRERGPAGGRVGQRAAAGHPHARGAGHHRLVRRRRRRRGHRPPQARARRVPGGGPPPRRRPGALHRLRRHRHRPRGRPPRRHDAGRRAPADPRRCRGSLADLPPPSRARA